MKQFRISLLIAALGIFLFPAWVISQEDDPPTDDLGEVTDAFQDNFFEALKQKGIENYELAIVALRKAEMAAGTNLENKAVVHFEMGKNLAQLERYDEAETRYLQVLDLMGDRLDVLEALYEVYYQQQNYTSAIPLVEKLINQDEDYKEDLANLYSRTQQYDKALLLLDELDESWGESDYRNALRRQIYKLTGNSEGAISNLEEKIDKNPKNERDYLNLIFLYSEQGDTEKAFLTAQQLLAEQPDSKLVHLALYKFYLDNGETEKALNSMDVVFSSPEIEQESKYRVLGDFIGFVNNNSEYEDKLEAVVEKFGNQNSGAVYEKIGLYFVAKDQKQKALRFYEIGTTKDPENYSLLKNTLLLQIDFGKFEQAAALSSRALEIFPAQALLYLLNGVSNLELSNLDEAIETMETGLDYLFDDPRMEKDFYEQLAIAYERKGNTSRAASFRKRASEITIAN